MPRHISALTLIRNELLNDPQSRGYAGKTVAQKLALINAIYQQANAPWRMFKVVPQVVTRVLLERDKWEAVNTAANDAQATGHAPAFKLRELCKLQAVSEDLSAAHVIAWIDALIAANVLSAADKLAMANEARERVKDTRANELGLGEVTQGDIEQAEALATSTTSSTTSSSSTSSTSSSSSTS